MPRLARAQEQARARISELSGRALTPERLGAGVVTALAGAIDFDEHSLFAVDPVSLLYTRLLAISGGLLVGPRQGWLREVYLRRQPDPLNHPSHMRAGLTAVAIHERLDAVQGLSSALLGDPSARDWQRRYRAGEMPRGGVLVGSFGAAGRWVAGLNLSRREARRVPFRASDAAFLRLLAPLLGRAFRAALDREAANRARTDVAPGAAGVLMLAANDRVLYRTPAADAWLALLADARRPEALGRPALPTALWAAVARVRAESGVGAVTVRATTPAGAVRIEAARGEAEEGDMAGALAIILTPERPSQPLHLPDAWPLTAREREVLAFVADGLGDKMIAARLAISEHTVATHLGHAYEKLGVHSRSQFLARLFHDAHLPALNPSS